MGYLKSLPRLSAITFFISQTLFTIPVFAAGFQINEMSPSLQGDAMAGAAAANNDVSSMYINPATLATLIENQAYFGNNEIMPHVHMSDASATHTVNIPGMPPTSIVAPVQGITSQHTVAKSAYVPDGYLGYRINERFVVGASLTSPFGLTTKYYNTSVLRFASVYSSVRTVNITPAVSYKINNQWAVGLGFQAQYVRGIFSNFNGPYTGISAIDAFIASNGPTYLKASSWGYGYTLGALYNPDLCTRVGIGFRSMISEQLRGYGQQIVGPGPVVPAPSGDFLFNAQTDVNAGIRTPAILTVSAAQDIHDWTIKATTQVNFWDTFNHLSIYMPDAFATNSTIQTKWRNTWFASLGADYRVACAWTVRGGIAFDQTPTRHKFRDPRIPDSNRYWLTMGATYALNKHISFDGTYEHVFAQHQSVNVTQASGSTPTFNMPLEVNQVNARFRNSVDIVALAARYSF